MTPVVQVEHVTRRYRGNLALDDVSFAVEGGTITGLLGRNGAGKTTVMRVIAAQEFASAGGVRVFGENPVENDSVLRRMMFVKESQIYPEVTVAHVVRGASWFCPNWDAEFAERLLADFALPTSRRVRKLSRGMISALGIVLGLASRAELTIFDEPCAGLDAPARQLFYDHLLADHVEQPRTVLLSTHLIDEAAKLLERVVVIDHGRIKIDADIDDIRGSAVQIAGAARAVDAFTAGRQTWDRRRIGSLVSVTVAGPLDGTDRAETQALDLDVSPVPLQQLLVHSDSVTAGPVTEGKES
ncbi:MAG TPA: ABC transporter ATP-binding protein [Acidothermaceae bacterium]|jgi:ABC-2 type transport system ATP-binding protein|nr:ABC transporter ATP-binding protein [Acidothermaceae bacterium]